MRVDKNYCMSSYLTYRYVYNEEICFKEGIIHRNHELVPEEKKIPCRTAEDIDRNIRMMLSGMDLGHIALLLSGGMDSAILASYMPPGTKAYTARCIGKNAVDETEQAKKYCDIYDLEHMIIDVGWDDYDALMDEIMRDNGAPIAPNEPQAYKIAQIAKKDGASCVIYGNCADTEFGGMDRLLAKDWTYEEWVKRYSFVDIKTVLKNPVDVSEAYEKYRKGNSEIDFIRFIKEVYASSSSSAYTNAFKCVGVNFFDPYAMLKMADPLDLERVRNGQSKYLIRKLFHMRFPSLEIPEKLPMSRPADDWMRGWKGPVRKEFKQNCTEKLSGEQKLLVYSLERFLNMIGL